MKDGAVRVMSFNDLLALSLPFFPKCNHHRQVADDAAAGQSAAPDDIVRLDDSLRAPPQRFEQLSANSGVSWFFDGNEN